jgi:hypothetical protein
MESNGGYLIPEIIRVNKKGKIPFIIRCLGKLINSSRTYEKGRYDFNLSKTFIEIFEATEKMSQKKVKRFRKEVR